MPYRKNAAGYSAKSRYSVSRGSAYAVGRRANMRSSASSAKYRRRSVGVARKSYVPRSVKVAPLHPFVAAVANPFIVNGGQVRIPDDTAMGTFCVTQTSSILMEINATNKTSATARAIGYAMRPSMNDGSTVVGGVSNCDAFLPLVDVYDQTVTSMQAPRWLSTTMPTGCPYTGKAYSWYNSGTVIETTQPKWLAGPQDFAQKQGVRARPVAWGIRVKYSGIQNAVNNVQPFGDLFFGVRRTEIADTTAPQDSGSDIERAADNAPFYDTNPGTDIAASSMENNSKRGIVGKVSLEQLRHMPDGIIIASGPCGPEERLFRDLSYWTGDDRVGSYQYPAGTTVNMAPNTFDLVGGQPWFYIRDSTNAVFTVDFICHWEVIPSAQAYTLPGSVAASRVDYNALAQASNVLAYNSTNQTSGATGGQAGPGGGKVSPNEPSAAALRAQREAEVRALAKLSARQADYEAASRFGLGWASNIVHDANDAVNATAVSHPITGDRVADAALYTAGAGALAGVGVTALAAAPGFAAAAAPRVASAALRGGEAVSRVVSRAEPVIRNGVIMARKALGRVVSAYRGARQQLYGRPRSRSGASAEVASRGRSSAVDLGDENLRQRNLYAVDRPRRGSSSRQSRSSWNMTNEEIDAFLAGL